MANKLDKLRGATVKLPKTFNKVVDVTAEDARRAAGKGNGRMHGKKFQLTTRIPEELSAETMERIRYWTEALHTTQNDLQAWCLLRGLDALDAGEQPQAKPEVTQRLV